MFWTHQSVYLENIYIIYACAEYILNYLLHNSLS